MKKVIVFLSCVWLAVNVLLAEEPYKYEYLYKDLPFEMPRVKAPVFPDNEVNLKDFGLLATVCIFVLKHLPRLLMLWIKKEVEN